jgi:hypothetical protein
VGVLLRCGSLGNVRDPGNIVHTAEFAFRVAGVDGEWDEAQRRATGLAEQAIEDFLETIDTGESITSPDNARSDGHQTASCLKPELRMVELVFDATNSKQRSDRIMRATSEEMSFEPSPDGDGWICTSHNGRKFEVDVDKGAGNERREILGLSRESGHTNVGGETGSTFRRLMRSSRLQSYWMLKQSVCWRYKWA